MEWNGDYDIITTRHIVRKEINSIYNKIKNNNQTKPLDFKGQHTNFDPDYFDPPSETDIHRATGIHRTTTRNHLSCLVDNQILSKYERSIRDNRKRYGLNIPEDWKHTDIEKLAFLFFLESELNLPYPFACPFFPRR